MSKKMITTLSDRQKRIVDFLLDKNGYVTAKEIADYLAVSTKTVYRDLETLKNSESETGIVIESAIGSGIRINNPSATKEMISQIPYQHRKRHALVMNHLLRVAPRNITLKQLSNRFYVSKTSIQADLKIVENALKPYDLKIHKGKKGVHVEGTEFDIRRALANSLISYDTSDSQYFRGLDTRLEEGSYETLCQQYSSELVDYIEYLVRGVEKELDYEIVDPYYINIVTHLLIMILRVMQGRAMDDSVVGLGATNIHKMRIAAELAQKIEERYRIKIPDSDVRYIYEHLDSIGYSKEIVEKTTDKPLEIDETTKAFALEVLEKMDACLDQGLPYDETVRRYVLLHIHSMIGRMRYRIDIKCSLLREINEQYSELFELTRKTVEETLHKYYPEFTITDDEVGYLTIYFQTLLENRMKETLRVIVVCSSSVGTSHMLMIHIKRKFPNWTILDELPASRLETYIKDYENVDLILSTVKIPDYSLSIPIAFVSVMFTDDDVRKVKEVLEMR